MQLACPACQHLLEYAAEAPCFCCHCGHALTRTKVDPTVEYDPEAATVPPSASETFTVGALPPVVGGYRLVRALGCGGMGTVYEAEEENSGRRVALKLISPEYATSKDAIERFRQEGRLASTIVHPRCVFVLAADEQAGQPYIAMELMPGETLEDLVRKDGPLRVGKAVSKIIDVIDGLQEVHRLGLVHRDIKPSNCFLDAEGRVKIGDFGLSKSLVQDTHLTKTGAFLGTPLYASPEQIKRESVDQQSDVYAVAATLYFLLTGRAPHQTGDAAATIARIVSDPAPSMRLLRKEIPTPLDRVVLRGLERDRKRRWKSLEEFRAALLPFVRRHLSIGGIGMRIWAYLVDVLLSYLALLVTSIVFVLSGIGWNDEHVLYKPLQVLGFASYFTVLEGIWGCSLGKRWLQLRVCSAEGGAPLGMARTLLRTLVFFGILNLGLPLAVLLEQRYLPSPDPRLAVAIGFLPAVWFVIGMGMLAFPMRKRNGYRALHDLLSGSRVVQLPWPARQRRWRVSAQEPALFRAEGLPENVGHFVIRGAIHWTAEEALLLAEDGVLQRKVWLWLHPPGAAPLPEARRQLARPTRLRWLASGHAEGRPWDAFLAPPPGWCLPQLIAQEKPMTWAEARPLLEQLTEELMAASRDGTMPDVLTPGQIWVQPDGRLILLATPLEGFAATPSNGTVPDLSRRALVLVRAVAVLLLGGRARPASAEPQGVRTPAPEHAVRMLHRLVGCAEGYGRLEQFQVDLLASRDRPAQTTRSQRGTYLVLQTFALLLAILAMLIVHALLVSPNLSGPFNKTLSLLFSGVVWPLFWVGWAFAFRGGWSLRLMGVILVDAEGRRASRLRCGGRALIFWLPFLFLNLLAAALVGIPTLSRYASLYHSLRAAPIVLLVYALLALVSPRRGLQDRLAGTYLVPR